MLMARCATENFFAHSLILMLGIYAKAFRLAAVWPGSR